MNCGISCEILYLLKIFLEQTLVLLYYRPQAWTRSKFSASLLRLTWWEQRDFFFSLLFMYCSAPVWFYPFKVKITEIPIINGIFKPVPDKWIPFLVLSWGGFVEQLSVTKITFVTIMNLVTPKAGVKLELLFNKLASVLFLAHAPSTWQKYLDAKQVRTFTNTWIRAIDI